MAIFCLATDLKDLENRIGNITIAYTRDKKPIYAKDLKAEGPMTVLLKDAIKPILAQTVEGQPAIVHMGPFGNIAHGCSSIIADQMASTFSEYVITEAGFGADPYCAMKAALLNYSGTLSQEVAPAGIRVNCVSPGPIFVEGGPWDNISKAMPEFFESTIASIPLGRMGTANEVANQVALLASPLAGNTLGTNIVIDGGFTKGIQF